MQNALLVISNLTSRDRKRIFHDTQARLVAGLLFALIWTSYWLSHECPCLRCFGACGFDWRRAWADATFIFLFFSFGFRSKRTQPALLMTQFSSAPFGGFEKNQRTAFTCYTWRLYFLLYCKSQANDGENSHTSKPLKNWKTEEEVNAPQVKSQTSVSHPPQLKGFRGPHL
jgi:hypothetical protein